MTAELANRRTSSRGVKERARTKRAERPTRFPSVSCLIYTLHLCFDVTTGYVVLDSGNLLILI